jgi:mercuric ion transport protein
MDNYRGKEGIVEKTAGVLGEGKKGVKSLLGFGIAGAVGSVACCAGPLILATLGIGGSIAGGLARLDPYRPWLMVLTVVVFGGAFWKTYRIDTGCAPGSACSVEPNAQRQRRMLWVMAGVALLIMAFPWYGAWLLR